MRKHGKLQTKFFSPVYSQSVWFLATINNTKLKILSSKYDDVKHHNGAKNVLATYAGAWAVAMAASVGFV